MCHGTHEHCSEVMFLHGKLNRIWCFHELPFNGFSTRTVFCSFAEIIYVWNVLFKCSLLKHFKQFPSLQKKLFRTDIIENRKRLNAKNIHLNKPAAVFLWSFAAQNVEGTSMTNVAHFRLTGSLASFMIRLEVIFTLTSCCQLKVFPTRMFMQILWN